MPETLAFTMRQSLVATDSAGRTKSLSTSAGSGPAGASGDAGSSEATMGVAGSAATAPSELAPHSDSATGTHKACRRKERNIIERLVDLAMPGVDTRLGRQRVRHGTACSWGRRTYDVSDECDGSGSRLNGSDRNRHIDGNR